MAKYLINPIYSYKEIKENFILYVKTAFGTRYDSIEKEREELLNTDSIASREPWIEPLPSYNNIERNGRYATSKYRFWKYRIITKNSSNRKPRVCTNQKNGSRSKR